MPKASEAERLINRFRNAPKVYVCGILHLKVPCPSCGGLVVCRSAATRIICSCVNGEYKRRSIGVGNRHVITSGRLYDGG